jgi:hypothetical protein
VSFEGAADRPGDLAAIAKCRLRSVLEGGTVEPPRSRGTVSLEGNEFFGIEKLFGSLHRE